MVRSWLEHSLTRGLPIDSPGTTTLRRQVIAAKPFLRQVYREWYEGIARRIPDTPGRVLELGAGAGFLQEHVPGVIRSEIFPCPGMAVVLDGCRLPFAPGSLRAVVMTDVFHHIPDARRFLLDASGAVKEGGAIVMVEPWVTPWSRFVYANFHHEPFSPGAERWEFAPSGPLSGANNALPWMVFERDRAVFEREFPQWRIHEITPCMPFRYLLSGGVSLRTFMPGWTFAAWRVTEAALAPFMGSLAMFATIVLQRTAHGPVAHDTGD